MFLWLSLILLAFSIFFKYLLNFYRLLALKRPGQKVFLINCSSLLIIFLPESAKIATLILSTVISRKRIEFKLYLFLILSLIYLYFHIIMRSTCKMSQNKCYLRYEKGAGRQKLFVSDPEADFFILFEQKLYCLRKQFVKPCGYLTKRILKNERVHVILQKLNIKGMQNVLAFIYGVPLMMQINRQIDSMMSIAKFLQFEQLQVLIKKQIKKNFNEYDLLLLLDFACNYTDQELQQRCYKELIKQNFEQLNINKYELLKCSESTFQTIMRNHQRLKTLGKINGLTFQNIRKIIGQYNQVNHCSFDILTVLASPQHQIIIEDPEGEKDSPIPIFSSKLKKHQSINHQKNINQLYFTQGFNSKSAENKPQTGQQKEISVLTVQKLCKSIQQNELIYEFQKNKEKSQKSTSPKTQQNHEEANKNVSFNKDISEYIMSLNKCFNINKQRKNSEKQNYKDLSSLRFDLEAKQKIRLAKSEQKVRK